MFRTIRHTIEVAGYICGAIGLVTFALSFAEYSNWPVANALSIPIDAITRPLAHLSAATFGFMVKPLDKAQQIQMHIANGFWLILIMFLTSRFSLFLTQIESKLHDVWDKLLSSSLGQSGRNYLSDITSRQAEDAAKSKISLDEQGALLLFRFIPISVINDDHKDIEAMIQQTVSDAHADIVSHMEKYHLFLFKHQSLAQAIALVSKLVGNIKTYNSGLLNPSEGYIFKGVLHNIDNTQEMFESDSYLKAVLDCAANNQILATPEAHIKFKSTKDTSEINVELDIIFHGVYVKMGPRSQPCELYRLIKQL